MITNNFNKELRGISDALRDLGYTDSTIGLRQRYWKEYCFFHGSLDIDESSMDEFLLKNYDIQSGNINVSKRQYEVRAALRNLLEYRRYGKIRNYHTPWFKDLPWVESFRAITENFISHLRSQNSKPETIVNYERTLKRFTNHLHDVGVLRMLSAIPKQCTCSVRMLIFITFETFLDMCRLKRLRFTPVRMRR